MGMTVLYIAFGIVALWLLAEVLMQYKARLRWRLLAFTGFLGVVAGVVLPSVLVIAVGAAAFATGQILVTLSFRKGFVAGWALRRRGGPARQPAGRATGRRRSGGPRPEPALQVTALEYGPEDRSAADDPDAHGAGRGFQAGPDEVHGPGPAPEDTGSYGVRGHAPAADAGETAAFASPFTTGEQDAHQYAAHQGPYGQDGGHGFPADYSGGYDGGYPAGGQQAYPAYSDPYIGPGGGAAPAPSYDYGYDPYADPGQQYSTDTPPGGVWVPQQRSTGQEGPAPYPPQDPAAPQEYPYPQQGTGEYEQYRY
ncbi:hypothetical protein GCM10010371_28220 [Streptomyces subrutilus]|uniref:Uncharacterized protein n=1 Tax=Streptomyces subrutilus TaxID=36818 RepID=A0A5P2UP96_9ACTN|nr:hypothetical protein [Streptomyces subrutilus]QEU80968.1 hypothetical protein CP968_24155 [Streptomyces subrutilus]GGZ66680.1 hypothetical protein GCM10010371_28220 [Streptomyces subrutilus]